MNKVASSENGPRVRKRAQEACTFCRKRKIKCNAEKPLCSNCKTYEKACIYDRPGRDAPTERPSSKSATDGNVGSTEAVTGRPSPSEKDSQSAPSAPSVHVRTPSINNNVASPRSATHNLSRIVVSANGMPSYHSQTSALYEENQQPRLGFDVRPAMSDDWVEKGLVAEAARQRQLEEYNFRECKLDFDGVEPDLGIHLLNLHWNRQHHSFLITYRPAFMRDMACNGPYFSKLLLNAIYFGASKFSPRPEVRKDPNDVRTAGWRFRERVRELLISALDRSDVTTIQALLVMTNSLFALGDERAAAWLYAGLAFRMIIDLGIHVDVADVSSMRNFSDEDLEIRRRVFWGAFVVDKIQSLYQGRPVTIKEADTRVPLKFLDTYEELEHWTPFAYSTQTNGYKGSLSYSVSTFTALCKLSIILSEILSSIYTEQSFDKSASELSKMRDDLYSKLVAWSDGLPSHLRFNPSINTGIAPPPHVLSLHAMYNVLSILLHRPFIVDGHLHSESRTMSVDSFMVCASAASNIISILEAYDGVFSIRRAPYLISYATYVAATIHVRIAAQKGPGSEAQRNLEFCLAVFQDNQETNSAVRRANMIVQNLMKTLGVIRSGDSANILNPRDSIGTTRNDKPAGNMPAEKVAMTGVSDQQNVQVIDTMDPSLDSFEIEEIIRMFAHEQRMQHANHDAPLPMPMNGNGYGQAQAQAPFRPQNYVGPDSYQAIRQQHEIPDLRGIQNADPGPYVAADDLLFGFNGSALDALPLMDWDQFT